MAERFEAKLGLNTSEYNSKLKDANKSMSAFSKGISTAAKAAVALFSIRAIVNFTSAAIKGYDVQAKAEQSLLIALKGREDIQRRIIRQASDLQRTTLFGDEQTIEAGARLSMMLGTNEEAIRRLLPLVQDLAQAKFQGNLVTAAELVAKSVGSTTNALTRYGIEITGAVGSSERLETAITALNKQVGGQAEAAAKVGTGALIQLKNAFGDLTEEIGKTIVASEGFNKIIPGITNFISNVVKFKQVPGMTFGQSLFAAIFKADEINAVIDSFDTVTAGMEDVVTVAEVQRRTLATLNAELDEHKKLLETIAISDRKGIENQVRKIQLLEEEIKLLKEPIRAAAITKVAAPGIPSVFGGELPGKELMGGPAPAVRDMTLQMEALRAGITGLESAFVGMFTNVQNGFQAMVNSFISGLARLAAQILAKAAVFALLSVISGGTSAFAGLAKGIVGGGFGNFAFGKFAKGGLAYGPTIGMVGEYAGARSNPEVIAPLDKLKGLMGAQEIRVIVDGKISGRDIRLANRRNGV